MDMEVKTSAAESSGDASESRSGLAGDGALLAQMHVAARVHTLVEVAVGVAELPDAHAAVAHHLRARRLVARQHQVLERGDDLLSPVSLSRPSQPSRAMQR